MGRDWGADGLRTTSRLPCALQLPSGHTCVSWFGRHQVDHRRRHGRRLTGVVPQPERRVLDRSHLSSRTSLCNKEASEAADRFALLTTTVGENDLINVLEGLVWMNLPFFFCPKNKFMTNHTTPKTMSCASLGESKCFFLFFFVFRIAYLFRLTELLNPSSLEQPFISA